MPKLLTPEEYEAEFGGGFRAEAPRAGLGTRLGASVDRAQAGLLGIGEAVGLPLGDMRRTNQFENQESMGRFFRDNPDEPQSWRDIDGVGSAGRYIRGLAIDSAPELATSLATGGAGALMGLSTAGRVGLAAAANYPAAAGDILQNQREEGGRTNIGAAALLGVPYAAADLVGLDAALAGGRMARTGIKRLDDMQGFRGGLARTGANVALNAPVEGASETFQEGINQLGRIAVNPNQTLFNDEANERYLDSFIGGAALGGSASAALGGWRRSQQYAPRTVDEGQFDLTGNGNRASAPQFNLTTEMDPLQGRINQNLGLQRTPLRGYEQQFLEAFNEPSGRFVSDPQTGVERELTAGELQQMQLGELKAQEEATTQREQQIAQETLIETSKALGVTPVANVSDAYDVLGARVYGQPQVAKLVQEIAVLNSQLPPEQQQLNAAILGANLVNFSGKTGIPTAQKIGNAINGKIKQLQLEGVESIERAAEILNDQVATLVAAGKNEGDVKLGQIATVYEKLTGQTPPALGGTTAPAAAPVAEKPQPKFQRAPAPQGQTNGQPSAPAGAPAPSVAGRSPDVPGSVVNPGRNAPVDAGVGGDAGVAGPAAQQAAPVPSANVQQPAAVEIDPTQYAEDEDAVEIAKLTGQGNVAAAIEEDAAGQRVDREDLQDEDIDAILNRRFADSKDPARDRRIFNAFLTATKYAPYGSVAKVKKAVGSDFGVEEKMVDKIGNPKELVRIGAELGYTQDQIEQAFGITTKRGGKPKADADEDTQTDEDAARAARDEAENAQEPVMGSFVDPDEDSGLSADGGGRATEKDMASGLTEAGFDGEGGFGLDDSRFWQKASSSGNKAAAPLLQIADTVEGLRQSIAELEAQGMTNAVALLRDAVDAQQKKLDDLIKAATPAPVMPKREVGADLAAAKQKFKDVGRDVTKMEIGELVLLRGEAERFSNKDLLAKIDAQLGDNVINVEAREVNAAPQIENAPTKVEGTVATVPKKVSGQTLWDGLRKVSPDLVAYDDLTDNERGYLTELADRTNGKPKLKDELGLQELMGRTAPQIANEPYTIDVEARVVEETLGPRVAALPAPQINRLEKHYGLKADSKEFLAKVKEDVVKYATQGAEAVAGAIRDIIKALHAGVLSVAMIFNPTGITTPEAYAIIPSVETVTTTREVRAELPAEVQGMSEAGKQAYATLVPALKGKNGDKLLVMADKPSGRMFVFDADGKLVVQQKALFGLAKGDFYKGNNDLPQNRITPAGLFGLELVDAAKGGSAKVTAGDYDFGKVFALKDPDAVVTIMHSVWLKEKDAGKRAAALKNSNPADSRYSFGCINVDKDTYKFLLDNYQSQMDGSKLFVVPDNQEAVKDFVAGTVPSDRLVREGVQPVTETVTTTRSTASNTAAVDRTQVGREERRFQSRSRKFFDFNDLTDDTGTSPQGADWLDDLGISHAMDYVSDFESYEDFDPEAESGEIVSKGGRYTMRLNTAALSDPEYAAETVTHEIAHAVDMAPHGGIYSSQFEMSVVVKDGTITPVGPVARELYKLYETNESWREYMEYPFDTAMFPEMDNATVVEAEMFAQLFSLYANPRGRKALERSAPVSAAFMKEVITHVKSTRSLQIQTGQTAAARTFQFKNRNAPQGAAVGQQAGGRTGQARLASRSTQGASKGLSVPPAVQPKVDLLTRTLRTGADAALNKIVFSEDLFKRASKMGLTAAMDMDRIYRERAALTGNIEREVTRIENLFNRIPEAFKGTGPRSANQFLYDSTRENKWGFTPTWRGADASKAKVDPALAARYNALPKEAKAWVSAVLQHGDKMLKMKKDTLIASTNSEYDALIADAKQRGEANKVTRLEKDKAASLRQFQRLFATTEFNPYAPMRRFGDFVVIGKSKAYLDATPAERTKLESDPDHYHVSFAESRASALELERQLKDQGSFSEVSARAKEEARGDMYGGLMDAFNKLRQNIDSELGNATEPKEIAALRAARETVAELYLQSLAENSSRKAEMRRRGVAGEIDMLRSFSTQGRADAHFLASAKYNPQASEAVVKMRQQAKEGGSQLEKSDAFKEIMARHTQSMRYEQGGWFDVAANTSRVTSIWMLATNPMYYLQNMTQPFVLSLPFMTGKHNWTDASGQLMRSYFQLGDLLKSAKVGEGFDFTKVSKDKAEQDMILKLVDRGRIDIGMDTELGQVKLEDDNVVGKAANRTDQVLRSLSQKVEAINRVSTALAAYRLEIKAGRTPAQALEYADEVISQTHGDYSRINAPRLFNTPGGKVALQFRKFQLIQLTLLSKLFYNSFANSNKAEKAAARKILTYTLAHTGVLAGVVGMPGFAAVAFIANNLVDLFGDDDEPYNLENEMRKMLGGGDVARLVMRGAPTLAGADLSGKLGMGNALSILPYTDFDATREGFNAIATGLVLGATGGLGAKVFEGLGQIKDGDYYRGLMNLSPTGVSQAMKAFVEAYQGETNKRGDVLVGADEIGTFETFAKMIGFPTSAGAERRFDRQVAYDNKTAFEDKSAKLKNEYTKAVRSNDSEARRATIEKWNRLQASRKEAGFAPQPLSSLMKAPQEQAKRERNTTGGIQFNKQNRQFVQEQTAN